MNHWILGSGTARHPSRALDGMIGAIGAHEFARQALRAINGSIDAGSWSVYRLHPDRAPVMHCSASLGVADTTGDCFAAYRAGLYRRDSSFDVVRALPGPGTVALLRMRAEDAPNRDHRDIIYSAHGLIERLSVAALDEDGSLLAVNLYRHRHQGAFSSGECAALAGIASGVLSAVRRHLALAAPAALADPRTRLSAACPALTGRELDVCERLLRGWSHDGIAADLGLSPATVKTYRTRAFERMGLHFRSELFARFGARS
jgi:DNA-binding CsgD family transcriptional regulator